jgi:pyridoxine kinase
MQKRVAAIHDISCFGRCSLTVALPVLSHAGIETAVIPTAVLSTHTGGFTDYTFRDLTDDILPVAKHWKTLGLEFDAIYTGYLGNFRQVQVVSEVIDLLKTEKTLVFVDPVMADNGKLYTSFNPEFPAEMAKLCRKADIIIPNMTEAAFLLNEQYKPNRTKQDITETLRKLSELSETVVLTGVETENFYGAAVYCKRTGKPEFVRAEKYEGSFHGTGDIFASVFLGELLNGEKKEAALRKAVKFTSAAIKRTYESKTDRRFGVEFELVNDNMF